MPTPEQIDALVREAEKARLLALATYSGFKVGAALLSIHGTITSGCNIEAANYSLTTCAERVALLKALSEGITRFIAIAIVADAPQLTPPCGSCRQFLWEYCGDLLVILASPACVERKALTMSELFPHPFGGEFLTR